MKDNPQRDFHYDGLTLRVRSSDISDLEWLEEFLRPSFAPLNGTEYDGRVALTADDLRFEKTLEGGPRADGAREDCFALESSWIRLPLWNSSPDERVIFDEEHGVFYRLKTGERDIEILTHAGNRDSRIAFMRVVRELAMTHSWQKGGLFIHGAAFSVGDRCVVVAGPKGAGKTTVLMYALHRGGAGFVSNDRVLVRFADQGVVGHGMPTIATIRKTSLELFPDLYSRLQTTSYDCSFSLSEKIDRRSRPDREGRFNLSPAQFCQFLKTNPVGQRPVGALIFPRVGYSNGRIELEPLSHEVAAGRLMGGLFRANSSQKTANLFSVSNHRDWDAATLEKLCLGLVSQVPCFDCHLGPDAFADPVSASILTGLVG